MAESEVAVAVVSVMVAGVVWIPWYLSFLMIRRFEGRSLAVLRLALAPLVAAVVLFYVLRTQSSFDVQDDPRYIVMYLLLGAAWVGLVVRFLPWFGLSTRQDVAERRNDAAAVAISGAILAFTFCYAGGNIGDGPGWWVVVIAALLSTAGLVFVWGVIERLSNISEVITIERDRAAGIRLAGILMACGLILGRAVAGDWVSLDATLRDFVLHAWPVLPIALMAVLVERVARPTVEQPSAPVVSRGAAPAVVYVGLAVLHIIRLPALT